MTYLRERRGRLQSAAPAIPANHAASTPASFAPTVSAWAAVAPTMAASAMSAPAISGNLPLALSGSNSASGSGLGATAENHQSGLGATKLSVGDEKADTDSESDEDKVYGTFLQVTAEVVATVVQNNPQPDTSASLSGLPTELTVMVYKNLDVIDAVCLGLTSSRHYGIYRDLFGTGVKLNTRRIGQAGTVERSWEVVGKDLCGHCGSYRCQLYRHINDWMGSNFEYCLLKENFGACAKEGARESCYRNKPSKPRRCGRHPVRTTTMHQDDSNFSNSQPYPF